MRQLKIADWQSGAMLSLAGILWMLSAAAWGRLSDRVGRKQVLLICLAGLGVSLLLFAWFVHLNLQSLQASVVIVVIALGVLRASMSLFYAGVPVAAQSKVADALAPQDRGPAMAGMGAAQGVGMIAGPAICSFLASVSLALPFWFTALLPFIGVAVVALTVDAGKASFSGTKEQRLKVWDPRVRLPLATAFACMFVVVGPQLTVGFLAIDAIKLTPQAGATAAGLAMTSVGVGLLVAQLLARKLAWTPLRFIRLGAPIAALGFMFCPFLVLAFPTVAMLCLAFFFAAFGLGFVWPSFQTATSNAVSAEEQGEAAGHVSAVQGAATVVSPFVMASLYSLHIAAPFVLAGFILSVLALVWWRVKIA